MLGDRIRRDIATLSDEERTLFVNAIRQLDEPMSSFVYGNNLGHGGADASGNITYWDMQEEIHKDGHANGLPVHGGPAFIPWHRALINHFEKLLRQVDSRLSLHYWPTCIYPVVRKEVVRHVIGCQYHVGRRHRTTAISLAVAKGVIDEIQ